LDRTGWLHDRIRVSKAFPTTQISEPFVLERLRQGIQVAEIPGLKLLARDADEGVRAASLLTQHGEPGLQCLTVSAIVVADHDEADPRFAPRPKRARQALLEVLLAFVRNAKKRQLRKQSAKKPLKEHLHRLLRAPAQAGSV
jgi:hypothetical protein